MTRKLGVIYGKPELRLLNTVTSQATDYSLFSDADIRTLSKEDAAVYADHLAEASRAARQFRARILRLHDASPAQVRVCEGCGTAMIGRVDRRFCSDACRQKAHRARNS